MARIVNLIVGLATACLGAWILFNLVPLLFDVAALQAVLIVLPKKYLGMAPAMKITLFVGILGIGIASSVWAGLSILRASSTAMQRINVILLIQLTITLIAAEGMARAGAAFELKAFSNLTYYINPACGDRYFRMARPMADAVSTKLYDPLLGWKPAPQPGKPSGLHWPAVIDGRPKAWFFGDSFTAGVVSPEDSIPASFEALQPDRQSMNFGVGGYGVDQIWLRYNQESARIPAKSPVYIGLLTSDLDRSVLRYFFGFKPVFKAAGADFQLILPPTRDDITRLANAPPVPIHSYAFAALRTIAELVSTRFDRSETTCNNAEKRAVNTYLMDAIIRQANARDHELRWIVFVSFASFYKPANWRHDFIKSYLDANRQVYLDTKDTLRRAAEIAGTVPESFYIPVDGHLNATGNRAVAGALAALTSAKRRSVRKD